MKTPLIEGRVRVRKAAFVLMIIASSSLACGLLSSPPPTSISFDAPPAVLGKEAFQLHAHLADGSGRPVAEQQLGYAIVPADVASVTAAGEVKCSRNGDAIVTMAGAGLNASAPIRCELVASIRGCPKSGPFKVFAYEEPLAAPFEAVDEAGKPIDGVAIDVTVSGDSSVAQYTDGAIVGAGLGKAVLTATASGATLTCDIEVWEREVHPILLNDGERVALTIEPGRHRIQVDVRAGDGSSWGVTATWAGAPGCLDHREAQRFEMDCDISAPATLIVVNPTMLALGPREDGQVVVQTRP